MILNEERKKVDTILAKFLEEPVDEALKKKIYDALTVARAEGTLQIPFKVILRKDLSGRDRDQIEVILETKL